MEKITLVVSDIHIGRADSKIKEFSNLLETIWPETIIFNGDIFDQFAIWKNKGLLLKSQLPYIKKIIGIIKQRKIKTYYLPGNHDYLALLFVPFGWIIGTKIRKRLIFKNKFIIEHGDWIKYYLQIRKICDKSIKIGEYLVNCETLARIKSKKLIIGHSHRSQIGKNVYDEGDWVENMTYVLIYETKVKIFKYYNL